MRVGQSTTLNAAITITETNAAPTLNTISNQGIVEGQLFETSFSATDPDLPTNTLIYSIIQGPLGASLDGATGRFRWSPPETSGPGQQEVTVQVSDGKGGTDLATFILTIAESNQSPVLNTIANQNVNEGTLLTLFASASDSDLPADTLTYSLGTAPAGASIDPSTGEFRWTPEESVGPGDYEATITVSDGKGGSDSRTFSITVNEVNSPPVLNAIPDRQVSVNQELTFTAQATDQDLPAQTIAYSLAPGAPATAAINAATGEFRWTPTETFAGQVVTITVLASDGANPALVASQSFSVTVAETEDECVFDEQLTGWTVAEQGGSTTGRGTVVSQNCVATLTEGDSFLTTLSTSFAVPEGVSTFSFAFEQLNFDLSSPSSINDAFEVALVDADGDSLVPVYAVGRDAFFNISEDVGTAAASGVTVVGSTVSVDLTGVLDGVTATLQFRLANNDSDLLTSVKITDVDFPASTQRTAPGVLTSAAILMQPAAVDPPPVQFAEMASGRLKSSPTPVPAFPRNTTISTPTAPAAGDGVESNLQLTEAALEKGFSLSTFAYNVPNDFGVGPLGIAFPPTGGALMTDGTGNLWSLSATDDNQNLSGRAPLFNYGLSVAIDLAVANGRIYMSTRDGGGRLLELNRDGTVAQEIASNLAGFIAGIAVNPVKDANGHHHLFVADLAGVVWDIDPIAKTKEQFLLVSFDGMSTDGRILYGADRNNSQILGFDIATKTLVFDSGPVPGTVDGTALGAGVLAGKLYINTNQLGVWELDLTTKEQVQIAGGPLTSRGDFVSVAPNGTLLVTQSDQVARLVPPPGGGFDSYHVDLALSATQSSAPAGSRLVVIGQAFSRRASDGAQRAISHVFINGSAVDVLDSTGNIFTQVEIRPGTNTFTVTALDSAGLSATAELSINGTLSENGIDLSRFADTTGSFSGVYGRTSFDPSTNQLFVDLATRNDGTFTSDVPLLVGVRNISDPLVAVVGADGQLPDGTPYFDFTQFVTNGRLAPGQTTQSPSLAFYNPLRQQFHYDLIFLGKLNEAPEIGSLPRTEVAVGRTYEYEVNASDSDNDPLTYSLSVSPVGMFIDASTGLITWPVNAGQAGQHEVVIGVTDGRGGLATQRFTISAAAAPPNRPPVITSTPLTHATSSDPAVESGRVLTARVRDFLVEHPDFQPPFGGPTTSLVDTQLGTDGTPVYANASGSQVITSAASFADWYHDVPGTNRGMDIDLPLLETSPGSGIYQFSNDSFFPIDNQLLGNEGAM